jgi:Na+/H+-dicarboxylate symporter
MIPTNIVTPFLENQVMAILLIGISVGIAIRFIPDVEAKKSVTYFFKGIHSIFFVMTKWIIAILPIGIYGFITSTVIQIQAGMDISGIGKYILIVVAANCIQGLVILPLWLKMNGIKPFDSLVKMMPALSVAFIFTTVIFLMQNHGIEITLPLMAGWIFIATIAAVGNAGVPMGCFFLSASLLSSMNVPIVLLGMILPFYTIIDMIETSLNVWSDSCVANVIDKKYRPNEEIALEAA